MDTQTTDRIVKEVVLSAPLSRVWRAISDAQEFGEWFKVDMSGQTFRPGQPVHGKTTYPGYEGLPFEMVVAQVEPERLFSFHWHPYSGDPDYDDAGESMTLVEFELEEVDGGTKLTVTESGFDNIPLAPARGGVSHEQRGLGDPDREHTELCRRPVVARL